MSKNGGKDRDSGGTGNGEKLTLEFISTIYLHSMVLLFGN